MRCVCSHAHVSEASIHCALCPRSLRKCWVTACRRWLCRRCSHTCAVQCIDALAVASTFHQQPIGCIMMANRAWSLFSLSLFDIECWKQQLPSPSARERRSSDDDAKQVQSRWKKREQRMRCNDEKRAAKQSRCKKANGKRASKRQILEKKTCKKGVCGRPARKSDCPAPVGSSFD